MKKIILTSLIASSLLIGADAPQNQEVVTNVKLGYTQTSGNTDTEEFTAEGKVKKEWNANSLSLALDAQYGNSANVITKNKYFLELEYGYKFTPSLALSLVLGYKNDKFSSYNYQSYIGPGLKYTALKSDLQTLDLEASVLYSKDELQDVYVASTPDFNDKYGSYKAKFNYELQLLENLKFNQEASYRASFDDAQNYFVFSKSELSTKLSTMFSAGISYKIDYTNLVATGIERRDNTLNAFISAEY